MSYDGAVGTRVLHLRRKHARPPAEFDVSPAAPFTGDSDKPLLFPAETPTPAAPPSGDLQIIVQVLTQGMRRCDPAAVSASSDLE